VRVRLQQGQHRIALEDIDIDGVHISAGDGIILDLSPANWDESVFPDPGRLDLERPADEIAYMYRELAFGVYSLPVTW
jgi:cytochrome P450